MEKKTGQVHLLKQIVVVVVHQQKYVIITHLCILTDALELLSRHEKKIGTFLC
jgi:hypothetical protein